MSVRDVRDGSFAGAVQSPADAPDRNLVSEGGEINRPLRRASRGHGGAIQHRPSNDHRAARFAAGINRYVLSRSLSSRATRAARAC